MNFKFISYLQNSSFWERKALEDLYHITTHNYSGNKVIHEPVPKSISLQEKHDVLCTNQVQWWLIIMCSYWNTDNDPVAAVPDVYTATIRGVQCTRHHAGATTDTIQPAPTTCPMSIGKTMQLPPVCSKPCSCPIQPCCLLLRRRLPYTMHISL